ncbi:MAG: hypothetical protein KDK65_00625 [Chlamydiia bacterium]|nr:hypothetical protein [Chlamydiia bacterium]
MHVDAVPSFKPPPLSHSYALEGNVDALHALITSGTPILSDSDSLSIWHFSAQGGNPAIIALVEKVTQQRFSEKVNIAPLEGPDQGHTVLFSACLYQRWHFVEQLLNQSNDQTLHQLPYNDNQTDQSPAALILSQGTDSVLTHLLTRLEMTCHSAAERRLLAAKFAEKSLDYPLCETKQKHIQEKLATHFGEAGEKFLELGQPRDAYRCFVNARRFGEQQLAFCSSEITVLLQFGLKKKAHQKLVSFIELALKKNQPQFATHLLSRGFSVSPNHLDFHTLVVKSLFQSEVTGLYQRSNEIWALYNQHKARFDQSPEHLYQVAFVLKQCGHQGYLSLLERTFWLAFEKLYARSKVAPRFESRSDGTDPNKWFALVESIIGQLPENEARIFGKLWELWRERYSDKSYGVDVRSLEDKLADACRRAVQEYHIPFGAYLRCLVPKTLSSVEEQEFTRYVASLPQDHNLRGRFYQLSEYLTLTTLGVHKSLDDNDYAPLLEELTNQALRQNLSWGQLENAVLSSVELYQGSPVAYENLNTYKLITTHTKPAETMWFQSETLRMEFSNLIFYFLLVGSVQTFQKLLTRYSGPLDLLRDPLDHTLLHYVSTALACPDWNQSEADLIAKAKLIFHKAAQEGTLERLLNARNCFGSNPLDPLLEYDVDESLYLPYITLFIKEPLYRVNDFLNHSDGMKADRTGGGKTLYHEAIDNEWTQVIALLQQRNQWLSASSPPEAYVNFSFPALNPRQHMYSPVRLSQESSETMQQVVRDMEQASVQEEDGNESDDSDDESAPAFLYCKKLRTLASRIQAARGKYQPLARNVVDQLNTPLHAHSHNRETASSLHQVKSKARVVHFHGVPLFPGQYTNAERRFVAERLCVTDQNPLGIHSRTSTANARMRHLYDALQASSEAKKKLETFDAEFRRILGEKYLDHEKEFLDVFKKFIYEFSDEETMQIFWKAFPEAAPLITYRFPFVSTSKAPDHAVKYAIGTYAETALRGEKALEPKYRGSKPTHRLAGLLYILMHAEEDIQPDQSVHLIDMTRLLKSKQIQSSGPRIDHQLEVTFFGGIDAKHIQMVIPIVWPNLSKRFKPGYHDVIWGLSERTMKEKVDHDKMKQMFTNFALKVVETLAVEKDYHLFYLKPGGGIGNFPLGPQTNKGSVSSPQKEIREGTIPTNGSPKEKLTHVSPEQTARRTSSSMLSSAYHFAPPTPQFSPAQAAAAAADPLSIQKDFKQMDLD